MADTTDTTTTEGVTPSDSKPQSLSEFAFGEDADAYLDQLIEDYEAQLEQYVDSVNGAIRTAVVHTQHKSFSGVAGPIYQDSDEGTTNLTG